VRDFEATVVAQTGMARTRFALAGAVDEDLFTGMEGALPPNQRRRQAAERLADAFAGLWTAEPGRESSELLVSLALAAEGLDEETAAMDEQLASALRLVRHLRERRPGPSSAGDLAELEGRAERLAAAREARAFLEGGDVGDEARVMEILARFERSADNLRSAAATRGAEASYEQGRVMLAAGRFLARLADRLEERGRAPDASDWRAVAHRRTEDALAPFARAMRTADAGDSVRLRAAWGRARTLEWLNDLQPAIREYSALAVHADAPPALRAMAARRLALNLVALGNVAEAAERLRPFVTADAGVALLAGVLREELGDWRGAWLAYRFASDPGIPAAPPDDPERANEARARTILLALRRPDAAERDVSEALAWAREDAAQMGREAPESTWTREALRGAATSWTREEGGWERAYRMARIGLSPDAPAAMRRAMHVVAGQALLAGGDTKEALVEFDLAREIAGFDPEARRDLAAAAVGTAEAYEKEGRADVARRTYEDVIALYPEAAEWADRARLALARLVLTGEGRLDDDVRERVRRWLSETTDRAAADAFRREYGVE